MIIIEGPDCAGKSTLAKKIVELSEKTTTPRWGIHYSVPPANSNVEAYAGLWSKHFVCDRFHASEIVYSKFQDNRQSLFSCAEEYNSVDLAIALKSVCVAIIPSEETIRKRWRDGEMFTLEQVLEARQRYDDLYLGDGIDFKGGKALGVAEIIIAGEECTEAIADYVLQQHEALVNG